MDNKGSKSVSTSAIGEEGFTALPERKKGSSRRRGNPRRGAQIPTRAKKHASTDVDSKGVSDGESQESTEMRSTDAESTGKDEGGLGSVPFTEEGGDTDDPMDMTMMNFSAALAAENKTQVPMGMTATLAARPKDAVAPLSEQHVLVELVEKPFAALSRSDILPPTLGTSRTAELEARLEQQSNEFDARLQEKYNELSHSHEWNVQLESINEYLSRKNLGLESQLSEAKGMIAKLKADIKDKDVEIAEVERRMKDEVTAATYTTYDVLLANYPDLF